MQHTTSPFRLTDLALSALVRPVKSAIWPGYETIFHPEHTGMLTNDNTVITPGVIKYLMGPQHHSGVPPYAHYPSHPDTISQALEDFACYAGEALQTVFHTPGYRGEIARSTAAMVLNRELGLLVWMAMAHWVRVWQFSSHAGGPSFQDERFPFGTMLDAERRSTAYSANGFTETSRLFMNDRAKDLEMRRDLAHLNHEIRNQVDELTQERRIFDSLRRVDAPAAGRLSESIRGFIRIFKARNRGDLPLTPLFSNIFSRFQDFARTYTCRADPSIHCGCPDLYRHSCRSNRLREVYNRDTCGGIRWHPALETAKKPHLSAKLTTCEFCLLDSVVSAGLIRHFGLALDAVNQHRFFDRSLYCASVTMLQEDPIAPATFAPHVLDLEPVNTIIRHYKFNVEAIEGYAVRNSMANPPAEPPETSPEDHAFALDVLELICDEDETEDSEYGLTTEEEMEEEEAYSSEVDLPLLVIDEPVLEPVASRWSLDIMDFSFDDSPSLTCLYAKD